jgi:hypothetical protein
VELFSSSLKPNSRHKALLEILSNASEVANYGIICWPFFFSDVDGVSE